MPATKPPALILGATGTLGSAIAQELHAAGYPLYQQSRLNEPDTPGAHIHADFQTPKQAIAALIESTRKAPPSVLIHACGGDIVDYLELNEAERREAILRQHYELPKAIDAAFLAKTQGPLTIVHISSSSALHKQGNPHYAEAKALLNHYITQAAKAHHSAGHTFYGIMPARVTPFQESNTSQFTGKTQSADMVARMVRFLVEEPQLSGTLLNLDANTALQSQLACQPQATC